MKPCARGYTMFPGVWRAFAAVVGRAVVLDGVSGPQELAAERTGHPLADGGTSIHLNGDIIEIPAGASATGIITIHLKEDAYRFPAIGGEIYQRKCPHPAGAA